MLDKNRQSLLLDGIFKLLVDARYQVVRSVNRTMVYAYFEIGKLIVEEEQSGKNRAEYGKSVLKKLSNGLTERLGKGFSVDNLENMRKFYLTYMISETLSRKSTDTQQKSETVSRISKKNDFQLSWSHYIKLIRIDNVEERKFYEIEIDQNNWSLREFKRQYDSALYQRLVLSKDKQGVIKIISLREY